MNYIDLRSRLVAETVKSWVLIWADSVTSVPILKPIINTQFPSDGIKVYALLNHQSMAPL
jgi:hypothetical protein